MDTEHRDLARQLFALATTILEDAVEAATIGQSASLDAATCRQSADHLARTAKTLSALAALAHFLADNGANADLDNRPGNRTE